MKVVSKLWFEAGPWMYLVALVFLVALFAMALQAVLSRKLVVPGLFSACSTAVLGTSLAAMAGNSLSMFDILFQQGLKPRALLRGSQTVHLPLLLALGMVAFLLVLRLVSDALATREVLRTCVPNPFARILVGLAVLALLSGGLLILVGQIKVAGLAAQGGFVDDPGATAGSLSRLMRAGMAMSLAAAALSGLAAVVSGISVAER